MDGYLSSIDRPPKYDVTPDDQRFVMLRTGDEAADTELILFDNWAEELKERAGN